MKNLYQRKRPVNYAKVGKLISWRNQLTCSEWIYVFEAIPNSIHHKQTKPNQPTNQQSNKSKHFEIKHSIQCSQFSLKHQISNTTLYRNCCAYAMFTFDGITRKHSAGDGGSLPLGFSEENHDSTHSTYTIHNTHQTSLALVNL